MIHTQEELQAMVEKDKAARTLRRLNTAELLGTIVAILIDKNIIKKSDLDAETAAQFDKIKELKNKVKGV